MGEQSIANGGGLQYVPQIAAVQYVYLDFDGELTSYNGEILTVENVEVQNSSLTKERIENILAELNAKYASQNVIFVSEKPAVAEYSTIYVGKTSAFATYGNFAGVAETIDFDNKNKTDKAFVMLDTTASDAEIISTISHETDHLLGTLDHGGSGLAAYADYYIIGPGETSTGMVLNNNDSMYIDSGGVANSTTVNSGIIRISSGGVADNTTMNGGSMYIFSGGVANNTTNSGSMYISSGGVANDTTVNSGGLYISSGGVANSTTVNGSGFMDIYSGGVANSTTLNGGTMRISSGGTASSTTVNYNGYMYISSGGTANNTTVNDWGDMYIYSGGVANNATINIGWMDISSGGTANYTTVNSMGSMYISSGGVHRGTLQIADGAKVSAYSGAIIDFTVADRSVEDDYLINDLSLISGNPTYTITVSPVQTWETYKLAQGAENFTGSISIGDGTTNFGSLTVNGDILSYNGIHYRLTQEAGNLTLSLGDLIPPEIPGTLGETISGYNAAIDWSDCVDNGAAGTQGYYIRYGSSETLDGEGEFVAASDFTIESLALGKYFYQVRSVDTLGNLSDWSMVQDFEIVPVTIQNVQYSDKKLSWDAVPGAKEHTVKCSDSFGNIAIFETPGSQIDFYTTEKIYLNCQVSTDKTAWSKVSKVATAATAPQILKSNADGNMDIFFAKADGKWLYGYNAVHSEFGDKVSLTDKNRISDVFSGSSDANILVLTDNVNGDALFVDDIYSVFGENARLSQINEIRAGLGDDVVDLTSQKYHNSDVTVYGGAGDDTIWASNGNNTLFGDAGNDRIVGGAGSDTIIGGAGNDSLHGGGGADIFCFGGDWGKDTIEQLSGGSVTLCFETNCGTWDAETMTYTCGSNSITVSGVSEVSFKFGNSDIAGAFDEVVTEKIFEDKNKALLA